MNDRFAKRTVVQAMAATAEIIDRGYTFVDESGRENFVPFSDIVLAAHHHAAALQALGLSRGDRVALIIPDHQPFVVTFLGTLAAGLVPVPIYPPLSLAKIENWIETTTGILRAAGAAAIVTIADVRALLWSTAARLGALIVTLDQLSTYDGHAPIPVDVAPDDLAFLQFTSGSTAAPRGVMVSHRNIAENCAGIVGELMQSATEDKGVSWLPLYHDMGLIGFVLAPLFGARPVTLLATLGFLKRPALWWELIHRHRATVTFAPNFGYALAARRVATEDLARWDLSCLRVAGCGGEPIYADALRAFAQRFAPTGLRPEALRPCYGMAEATLVVTYSRIGQMWRGDLVDAAHLRSAGEAVPAKTGAEQVEFVGCGAPLANHSVRILDEQGRPLPDRVIGEIEFRGPSLTLGYFGDPDATAKSYRNDSLRTGDLGYLAEGQLFVTGRKKDLIIVRGRKYAPQTIEWSVGELPQVRKGNVVAFAGPGERGAEGIVIVCEAAAGEQSELERAIRTRVSDDWALTVRDVVILGPGLLPKTSSGKVQRAKTRELYLDGTLRRMAAAKRPTGLARRLLLMRLSLGSFLGRLQYKLRRTLLLRLREPH